jgi:hypothetical protein
VELVERLTSAFKKLDPVPQFKTTAKLGGFSRTTAGITTLAPFRVAIILNGSVLFQYERASRDSDPFNNFLEGIRETFRQGDLRGFKVMCL